MHEQINSLAHFFKDVLPRQTLDVKLNLASANYELTQSIPRVVEYFGPDHSSTWDKMSSHEETLQEILLSYLNSNPKITIYGEPSANKDLRVPVISFVVAGAKSQAVVEAVERKSPFGFRSGHMYSHRLLGDISGLEDVDDGVIRVSLLHYNTGESPLLCWLVYCPAHQSSVMDHLVEDVKALVKVFQEVIPSE